MLKFDSVRTENANFYFLPLFVFIYPQNWFQSRWYNLINEFMASLPAMHNGHLLCKFSEVLRQRRDLINFMLFAINHTGQGKTCRICTS
jgi:hypothetical protein